MSAFSIKERVRKTDRLNPSTKERPRRSRAGM